MNFEIKLMEFVRNCYNFAGPSKCKTMKVYSYRELDVVLLQIQAEGASVCGPMCAQRAKFFVKY